MHKSNYYRLLSIMRIYFILFFSYICSLLFSQNSIVTGKIIDSETGLPIAGANILADGKTVISNSKGYFLLTLQSQKQVKIIFSHLSYYNVVKNIITSPDTLLLNIKMVKTIYDLPEVDIVGNTKPDTVVGNNNFFIQDFEFKAENIVLLVTDRKTNKYAIVLAKEGGEIITQTTIPNNLNNTYSLFVDFLGNINVIGKSAVYRLKFSANKIILQQLPAEDFRLMIMPCVDTIGNKIYFSNYRNDYPEFNYYKWTKSDSTASAVHHVVDKPLADLYAFEYYFLPPKLKLYARKLEQESGIDKHQIAAYMTNFSNSRYFTPLYAPMFIINDTVLVFDHYADKIFKYDSLSNCIDSIPISYHHPQKWREWKKLVIKDDDKNCIYGLFLKGNTTYLKEIDCNSGNIISVSKLELPFVEKVKIKNGYAYYIYRPHGSLQTKFLYKEKIISSH